LPNFSDIVDAYKKLPTSLFLTVGIVISMILFAPEGFTKALGLQEFRESYKVYIGPVWILMIAILISRLIGGIQEVIRKKEVEKGRKK